MAFALFRRTFLSSFFLLLSTGACGRAPQKATPEGPPNNACEAIENTTFISTSDHLPIGETQAGTVYGHWLLVFSKNNNVCSGHDDSLRDDGSYTCDGWQISAHFYGLDTEGTYDAESETITWAGQEYEKYTNQKLELQYCGVTQ